MHQSACGVISTDESDDRHSLEQCKIRIHKIKSHHWGQTSCRHFLHQWNWWRSRACSAAAYGDVPPCRTHFQPLETEARREGCTLNAYTISCTEVHICFVLVTPLQMLHFAVIVPKVCGNWYVDNIFGRKELIAPLQFLAILNMFAALQYISQASSTFWGPLDKERKQRGNRTTVK